MTLTQAFRRLQDEADTTPYRELEKILVSAGYCPSCAEGGHRARLRKWTPGSYYEHAGRECFECEEFYPCGPQPEYGGSDGPSDADPGL